MGSSGASSGHVRPPLVCPVCHPDDKPSIGLLLCQTKNRLVAEYVLRGFQKPIGVAEWETELVKRLPEELPGSLPTVEQIEKELAES